jgi:hypothetical protein
MFLFLDPSDELVGNGFKVREEDVLYNWADKTLMTKSQMNSTQMNSKVIKQFVNWFAKSQFTIHFGAFSHTCDIEI